MKMRRHTKAVALVAASAILAMALGSFGSANAQSGSATRLCTWGGTPANPTGIVTFEPGLTNTPSAGPIAILNAPPVLGLDLASEGLKSLAPEFIEERAQLS